MRRFEGGGRCLFTSPAKAGVQVGDIHGSTSSVVMTAFPTGPRPSPGKWEGDDGQRS